MKNLTDEALLQLLHAYTHFLGNFNGERLPLYLPNDDARAELVERQYLDYNEEVKSITKTGIFALGQYADRIHEITYSIKTNPKICYDSIAELIYSYKLDTFFTEILFVYFPNYTFRSGVYLCEKLTGQLVYCGNSKSAVEKTIKGLAHWYNFYR